MESPLFMVLTIVVMTIMGVFPSMIILITQNLINQIQSCEGFNPVILLNILMLCAGYFLQGMVTELYSYYGNKHGKLISKSIDMKILEKSTRLKLSDYENPDIYDVVARAQNQSGEQMLGIYTNSMNLIKELGTLISSAIILFRIVWWFIPVCLVIPILKAVVSMKLDRDLYEVRKNRTKDERKIWYIRYLLVLGKGIKEARIFQFDRRLNEIYANIKNQFLSQDIVFLKRQLLLSNLCETLSSLLQVGMLIFIFLQAALKKILLGDLTGCLECIEQIKDGGESIFVGLENIVNESMYVAQIFEYLDLPEDIERPEKIETLASVEFQDVCFGYSERRIINHISFKLKKGDTIIIEGENGSGKTTLIKLLLGFYDNYSGQIKINGTELRAINRTCFYKKISCLFQNFEKLETSVEENVTCGHEHSGEPDVESCLKAVGIDEKIENIGGIYTVIGNWFGSQQLSGGEWKKLAIARSLYKESDLVIWDEPEASLDCESKKRFFKEQHNRKNCITVIISHSNDVNLFYSTENKRNYFYDGMKITIMEDA